MNKLTTETHICEWLSKLGSTKASHIGIDEVRQLVKVLYKEEYPEQEEVKDNE